MTVLHVLHVDDKPDIRDIFEVPLGLDPALMIKSCASVEHAPALASDRTPDLMLRDFVMPVIKRRNNPCTFAKKVMNRRRLRHLHEGR